MIPKDHKSRLYWLIDNYLSDKFDENTFCEEFYRSYNLEVNHQDFSPIEEKAFSELSAVTSRFSEFPEDYRLDDNAFATREELKRKIQEVQKKLTAAQLF